MNLPTCRELIDFLSDYLADELPAETRAAFDKHLYLCPDCVCYLENLKATVQSAKTACRELPTAEIPEALIQAILKARAEQ